jgi:hypothetical protein
VFPDVASARGRLTRRWTALTSLERAMRCLVLLVICLLGQAANAQDLSVRLNASGEYEAVLSIDVFGCGPFVTPAESITIASSQITIVGEDFGPIICGVPPSGGRQTAITPLGSLAQGQYQLTWSQPNFFSVSVAFGVPFPPTMIPWASPATLGILVALVMLLAVQSNYAFKRTAGTGHHVS